jgi:hypothetical protein
MGISYNKELLSHNCSATTIKLGGLHVATRFSSDPFTLAILPAMSTMAERFSLVLMSQVVTVSLQLPSSGIVSQSDFYELDFLKGTGQFFVEHSLVSDHLFQLSVFGRNTRSDTEFS